MSTLRKDEQTRLEDEQNHMPEEAKELRRNFARLMLAKLDAQIQRGRITDVPRKDSHDLSPGS